MSKIIITGVTGFIGAAVALQLLSDGVEVHALLRQDSDAQLIPQGVQLHRLEGSVDQLTALMQAINPDAVIHLASFFLAEHNAGQVTELVNSNVLFGSQLLEAMARCGVRRFINTGTSWQHYTTDTYRPVNLYAATKQAFDDILCYYGDVHDISWITLKLYDTYGPGDRRRKLVKILLDAAASGELMEMSPGEQILDLSYIDDIASAYAHALGMLLAAENCLADDYLVSGSRHTLQEVVAVVAEVSGKAINVLFGGRPYRNREVMLPVDGGSKALPDWAPRFDLRSGLANMLP